MFGNVGILPTFTVDDPFGVDNLQVRDKKK
jgi:hypothetical protein